MQGLGLKMLNFLLEIGGNIELINFHTKKHQLATLT